MLHPLCVQFWLQLEEQQSQNWNDLTCNLSIGIFGPEKKHQLLINWNFCGHKTSKSKIIRFSQFWLFFPETKPWEYLGHLWVHLKLVQDFKDVPKSKASSGRVVMTFHAAYQWKLYCLHVLSRSYRVRERESFADPFGMTSSFSCPQPRPAHEALKESFCILNTKWN